MLCEELMRIKPSSLFSNPKKTMIEFTNCITKACEKAIPRIYINGWREITWWISDLTKMKKQTNLYRRRLKKTLDLEEEGTKCLPKLSLGSNTERKHLEKVCRG